MATSTDSTAARAGAARTLRTAAVLGALGVALGAFGAHALAGRLDASDAAIFETAVRYQLVHAVALLAVAALHAHTGRGTWPARLLCWGTVVFSGSLYLLVLTGARWLGAITPLGGTALIAGWLALAISSGRRR